MLVRLLLIKGISAYHLITFLFFFFNKKTIIYTTLQFPFKPIATTSIPIFSINTLASFPFINSAVVVNAYVYYSHFQFYHNSYISIEKYKAYTPRFETM